MFNAIIKAIRPRGSAPGPGVRPGIERARYTVSWYMTGVRPAAPRSTTESRP